MSEWVSTHDDMLNKCLTDYVNYNCRLLFFKCLIHSNLCSKYCSLTRIAGSWVSLPSSFTSYCLKNGVKNKSENIKRIILGFSFYFLFINFWLKMGQCLTWQATVWCSFKSFPFLIYIYLYVLISICLPDILDLLQFT